MDSTKSVKKKDREKSLQEIADKLNLSKMRICQLEKQILAKLKKSKLFDGYE